MVEFDQLEDSQKLAALAHDRNYAVTAGAGSGKTTTFAMRYLQLLARTDTDPTRIAAITFTESGATELQERVREAVSDRLHEGADYDAWREYHDLLPEAYIHTIHGFCARVLREYALEADVPIGFDVIDETAARGYQRSTIEAFVDDHLEDARIERLSEIYYRSRLEDLLADLLKEHHHARGWANEWADRDPTDLIDFVRETFSPIDVDQARELLGRQVVREALQDIQRVAREETAGGLRINIANNVTAAVEAYGAEVSTLDGVEVHDAAATICEALTTDGRPYHGGWDSWCYGGYDDWDDANEHRYGAATSTLVETLPVDAWAIPGRLATDRNAAPYYVAFASLFQDLHEAYQDRKRRERVLDFADLIDATIELLRTNPTVREALAESFDHVMLDEVQDTDPRQWEIVQLLTSIEETYDGLNVFVVGDEKQSIFRFRGADVSQYSAERARLDAANERATLRPLQEVYPASADGDLSRNFRSLPAVIEPVNDLFDGLFGAIPPVHRDAPEGIRDDDRSFEPEPQRLAPDRTDDDAISTGTTLVLVPEQRDVREVTLSEEHPLRHFPDDGAELDARALAAEVAAVLDSETERYEITGYEDGTPIEEPTRLEPSDVAILLRKRTHLQSYERALAAANVPYVVASGIGFFERSEIVALRNLFAVLLDPDDDLALYGVLRSPLFGFTDTRIVGLWTHVDRENVGAGELWHALEESTDEEFTAAKDRIEDWRRLAGVGHDLSVVETWDALLGRIIDDTGYLASLALDERGEQAIANVEKFRDRLRGWSDEGLQTLPAVVDRLQREVELSTREGEAAIPEDADGVRIMTVHDAKGQEFPAVFVPGITKPFNLRVAYGEGIAEFETIEDPLTGDRRAFLGIRGPGVEDPFEQRSTILKRRLEFHRKREAIAEEKRILYVAMTRARDHLYLVGTASTEDGSLDSIDTGDDEDPSNWYDLIAPPLLDEESIEELASNGRAATTGESSYPITVRLPTIGGEIGQTDASDPPTFDTDVPVLATGREYSIAASYLGSLLQDGASGDVAVDHTGQYVSYTPPDDYEATDEEGDDDTNHLPRNVFGDILHKVIELRVDPADADSINRLAQQFALQANIDPSLIEDTDIEELQQHARVAVEYLASIEATRTVDEKPVRAILANGEVYGDIDRLFVTDDGFQIVDYKTNDIADTEKIDEKDQFYTWQMKAYAVALHQADPDRTVTATLLFTKTDTPKEHSWTPPELDALTTDLDDEIRSSLSDYL